MFFYSVPFLDNVGHLLTNVKSAGGMPLNECFDVASSA